MIENCMPLFWLVACCLVIFWLPFILVIYIDIYFTKLFLFYGLISFYPCNICHFWFSLCKMFLLDFILVKIFCFRIPPRPVDCAFLLMWHAVSPFYDDMARWLYNFYIFLLGTRGICDFFKIKIIKILKKF